VTWAQRCSDLSIRFYEAIRSPEAARVADGETGGTMASLAGRKYALVVTYRQSGEAVPTPVWFGMDDDRLYFRSVATGRKLDRIADNPEVLVAPCRADGRPLGPPLVAHARVLDAPADEEHAEAAIRSSYGAARRLYARLIAPRVPGRYVEVRATPES
jgi:PPOX class probable F420-dependent enzyme